MIRYAMYGAAGCGRSVMPFVRRQLSGSDSEFVFVDDDRSRQGMIFDGVGCISFEELVSVDLESTRVCVAVAQPEIRKDLVARCLEVGLDFFDAVHAGHDRYDGVDVGPGAILCANTLLTTNIRIGAHFHCNLFSYVEHDCRIGDFVTFGPRVSCNGNTEIGDGAYIGSGSVLKQGREGHPLVVGEGAVVGMGSVVISDVEPGTTVAGNPARLIR